MNGCDHQPVQKNLSQALRLARKLYPDIDFVHSSFEEYIATVKEELPKDLSRVKGELTSYKRMAGTPWQIRLLREFISSRPMTKPVSFWNKL